MAEVHGAGPRWPARPLFEQLLASRPARDGRGGASATAAAVALHGALAGAVLLATVLGHGRSPEPVFGATEEVMYLSLTPPARVARAAASAADAAAAAARASRRAAEEELRRLVAMLPPAGVPATIPPPGPAVLPALAEPEFAGVGSPDGALSAAKILRERVGPTAEALAGAAPVFTPYTLPPELLNRDEIRRALQREYPLGLQDMGIGGQVLLWFLIDETGHALKWELKESSGYRSLDKAALKVAARMRFRPAQNYDHAVPVWVVMPIRFRVVEAAAG